VSDSDSSPDEEANYSAPDASAGTSDGAPTTGAPTTVPVYSRIVAPDGTVTFDYVCHTDGTNAATPLANLQSESDERRNRSGCNGPNQSHVIDNRVTRMGQVLRLVCRAQAHPIQALPRLWQARTDCDAASSRSFVPRLVGMAELTPTVLTQCIQCERRCIRKMDHHCFWIGTCVGERNHGRFLLRVALTVPHSRRRSGPAHRGGRSCCPPALARLCTVRTPPAYGPRPPAPS
jgi:hypothetical protein